MPLVSGLLDTRTVLSLRLFPILPT